METNADKVRRAFERLMEGEIDAAIEISHSDVAFVPMATGVGEGPYSGHDGLRRWYSEMQGRFERMVSRLDSVAEHGDLVFAQGEIRAIGSGDTRTVRSSIAWVVEMRDGKAARIAAFADLG